VNAVASAQAEPSTESVELQILPSTARVELKRAYKFRLYPMAVQAAELEEWSRTLRRLYNLAHEQRLNSLRRNRVWLFDKGKCPSCRVNTLLEDRTPVVHTAACDRVDYFRQSKEMTLLLSSDDQLARVVCSARQEVLRDLDKAWQRWRKMPGVGRPKFKRHTDFCRVYFSTPKHWKIVGRHLSFSGLASSVGDLRIELDRPWPKGAKFSSCAIVRDVEEWYAVFPLVFTEEVEQAPHRSVGINRGGVHAIADSNGRVVDSPKFYERALATVQRRSRDLSRKQPGSRNAEKARLKLAKAHQKVRRQRQHFLHEQSAYYAAGFDLVAIEDMSIQDLVDGSLDEGERQVCRRDGCEKVVKAGGLCSKHLKEHEALHRPEQHRSILDVGM
jgi:transposase